MLLWALQVYISFQISVFVFLLDVYPGVRLLGHMVVLFLVFWETSILFPQQRCQFTFPSTAYEGSLLSTSSPTLVICVLFEANSELGTFKLRPQWWKEVIHGKSKKNNACRGNVSVKALQGKSLSMLWKKLTEACVTEASGPAVVGRINWRIIKTEVFMISYGIIAETQVKDESSSGRVVAIKVEKHIQIQDIF